MQETVLEIRFTAKVTSANLKQLVHDIIKYPTFIYTIESWKCGKKAKNVQKFEYLRKK